MLLENFTMNNAGAGKCKKAEVYYSIRKRNGALFSPDENVQQKKARANNTLCSVSLYQSFLVLLLFFFALLF